MSFPEAAQYAFPADAVLMQALNSSPRYGKTLLFTNPVVIVRADAVDAVLKALSEAELWLSRGFYIAGYVAYEAGYAFEERFAGYRTCLENGPLVWFGVYRGAEPADAIFQNAAECQRTALAVHQDILEYSRAVQHIRDYIADGDAYQVNYTYRASLDAVHDPFVLYKALCRLQRCEYAAYVRHDERSILSLSPELFFHVDGDAITTRPMKGTTRRGRSSCEDRALAAALSSCPKNRAENTMIVDLLRNDLGRICKTGSVSVRSMFDIERYETLHQMTSTVTGVLRKDVSFSGIFLNLFPSGSVTGAPKIRAMEIIHELEETPRGVYTGSIGYASPTGEMLFNVAIRTLVIDKGKSVLGIGSGVVWDSDAGDEYRECLLKSEFLRNAGAESQEFKLVETLRYEDGFPLLSLHLDRLAASAHYFGFIFSRERVIAEIDTFAGHLGKDTRLRVRLMLSHDGSIVMESAELKELPQLPVGIGFSGKSVHSDNAFLYHKTTRRELYETELKSAQEQGLFDVLFLNERGEVTEGCITNVFIEKHGKLLTPPIASGLLGGVYRRHVLETNSCANESVLNPDDLLTCDRIFVCNAVRGMIPAVLTGAGDLERH
ncbi:MAG: para-aminobenzoate synthetase / 4-amino-4-deoxychorismate lyase [Nitrospirae bacterium]|nr:MAG: para-aminobenzoate synthetase / 4-amino-4-deoxychorismate lyase [Nitrospirota bacterium]